MMFKPLLKVLILEDVSTDAELIQLHLEELEYDVQYKITDKADEYKHLLDHFSPNLVVADFNLPGYNGLKALQYLRTRDINIPFIFVTGVLQEDDAISAIKNGASDFLIKENIHQLPKAILKALREHEEIRQKEAFERQLLAINALNSSLLQHQSWKSALKEAFEIIGKTLKVDRVYYFQNANTEKEETEMTSQQIEWTSMRAEPQIENPDLQKLHFSAIPELIKSLQNGHHYQAIVPDMPPSSFKEMLLDQDICSILVLPLFVKGRFHGFIGFDDCVRERQWSADEHEFLASLTSSLSNAIEKADMLEHLSRSERNLRKAQKIAGLGYWSHILDEEVSDWSEECYRIYGYSPGAITPTFERIKEIFHPDDRELLEKCIDEISGSEEEINFEHRIFNASGEMRWIDLRINLIEDEQGKPYKIEGTIQDITESRQQFEKIKQQNEILREIAWMQSHVVRAPLSRIIGLVHLLQDKYDAGKSISEILDLITEATGELDEVIKDIANKTELEHKWQRK